MNNDTNPKCQTKTIGVHIRHLGYYVPDGIDDGFLKLSQETDSTMQPVFHTHLTACRTTLCHKPAHLRTIFAAKNKRL